MGEINLAKKLIIERHKKGISQEELAMYIGVSKAAVSKWEKGQNYPDITFLPQLATYFNITIDELMGYEPQLTREEIRKQYYKLADKFALGNYEDAIADCEDLIRKYYSCYPLLLQMAVLYMNHSLTAKEKEEMLQRGAELASKVRLESANVQDAKEATLIEATCYLMMEKPEEALNLVDDAIRPIGQETELLAQIYQAMGNLNESRRTIQIALYQHLLLLIGDSVHYMLLCEDDFKLVEGIIERTGKTIDIFEIDNLHPNTSAVFYLTSAQIYCQYKREDAALDQLKKYVDLCTTKFFPLTLHGDDYFNQIDQWFEEFDLGKGPVRNEKFIKQSIFHAVSDNPFFFILKDNDEYKNLLNRLRKLNEVM